MYQFRSSETITYDKLEQHEIMDDILTIYISNETGINVLRISLLVVLLVASDGILAALVISLSGL